MDSVFTDIGHLDGLTQEYGSVFLWTLDLIGFSDFGHWFSLDFGLFNWFFYRTLDYIEIICLTM
jgi:hypothetical protein